MSHIAPRNRRNIPAKTRYFLISSLCFNLLTSLPIFFLIESVKKLFHFLHPFIRECIGRNDIRNFHRGYLYDFRPYILPSDVMDGTENHIEISDGKQGSQHDNCRHSLSGLSPEHSFRSFSSTDSLIFTNIFFIHSEF